LAKNDVDEVVPEETRRFSAQGSGVHNLFEGGSERGYPSEGNRVWKKKTREKGEETITEKGSLMGSLEIQDGGTFLGEKVLREDTDGNTLFGIWGGKPKL